MTVDWDKLVFSLRVVVLLCGYKSVDFHHTAVGVIQRLLYYCMIGWNHHCKHSTVVITKWLTVTKYAFLKWQWTFSFIRRFFSFLFDQQTFTGLDYEKQELLTLHAHLDSLPVFSWVVTLHDHLGSPPGFSWVVSLHDPLGSPRVLAGSLLFMTIWVHPRVLAGSLLFMTTWVHPRVLAGSLLFMTIWVHPRVLAGSCCASF